MNWGSQFNGGMVHLRKELKTIRIGYANGVCDLGDWPNV